MKDRKYDDINLGPKTEGQVHIHTCIYTIYVLEVQGKQVKRAEACTSCRFFNNTGNQIE